MRWIEEQEERLTHETVLDDIDSMGDAELLKRVQQKEDFDTSREAMGAIFSRYRADVEAYIQARFENPCDAGEVEIAVWDIVYRKVYQFQWRGVPLKHWLMAIARRRTNQFLKDNVETVVYFEDFEALLDRLDSPQRPWSAHPSEEEEQDRHTLNLLFVQFLRRLKLHEQKILLLTKKGWNASQIASELGMKAAAVRQAKKRAISKMKTMYDENEEELQHDTD